MRKRKQKKGPEIAIASAEETTRCAREAAESAAAKVSDGVPAGASSEADGGAEVDALDPEVLLAERNEWRDKALRAKAEFQNLQRRTETERHNAVRFANAEFARSLLVILDDIGRTLDAGRQDTDRKTLLKSVEILNDHFAKILGEHHVTMIEAEGKPFDPAIHQALVQQPCPDREPGTVVGVIENGYMLYDRVLRPAKVVVSSASPDEQPTEAGDSDSADTCGGSDDDADI